MNLFGDFSPLCAVCKNSERRKFENIGVLMVFIFISTIYHCPRLGVFHISRNFGTLQTTSELLRNFGWQ